MSLKIGTTFTPITIKEFGLEVMPALKRAIALGFDYLRIGSYWSEIENTEGIYDFSSLKEILNLCQKSKQKVVLTLGMKAPRWPEFYFPSYLNKNPKDGATQAACLKFLKETIKFSQQYDCISHFQLENEALDPSGPGNDSVPLEFLKQEIELIKELDNKPIIISLWGNLLSKRKNLEKLATLADILALDLYDQQFVTKVLGKSIYAGPSDNYQKIAKLLKAAGKETWIMELQAEPWESSREEYLANDPESISPEKIRTSFEKAKKLPVSTIFFWGFEYAHWQAEASGNSRYLDLFSECIIKRYD